MKVKICGLSRREDIQAVNEAMPDYIGYVFAKSKRQVRVEQVEELNSMLNPAIMKIGVFVNHDLSEIIRLLDTGVIDGAQLHGQETKEDILRIQEHTGKLVIKAVSIDETTDFELWNKNPADYLLLDNKTGGTGKSFDWSLLNASIEKPFFLAGGIHEGNLYEAMRTKAFALDISSGAETDGKKDFGKIQRLVGGIRNDGDSTKLH